MRSRRFVHVHTDGPNQLFDQKTLLIYELGLYKERQFAEDDDIRAQQQIQC